MDREPSWTAEMMNRKKGDTTFEFCGWCEHRGCGSYRYDTMLDGSCNLLRSYDNKVQFDTPCHVVGLGKDDLESLIGYKNYETRNSESRIKDLKAEKKVLQDLQKKAKKSPPLPDSRKQDFELNDVVYVFHENKWNRGVVVMGYRHKDGCVSYMLDNYPASNKGWGCGTAVPCILKEWEYKYFQANLDEFKEWLRLSDRSYNGDQLDMVAYHTALAGSL